MKMTQKGSRWVEGIISGYVMNSPDNSLRSQGQEKAWDSVLIGYAKGSDPIFEFFKKDIGAFYWTPWEIFSKTFPVHKKVEPHELTIISWILPQSEATKRDNRAVKDFPAERWVRSRNYGEVFNVKLAQYLVKELIDNGFDSVAPAQSPDWAWRDSERYGFASNWSERHAAYAAGLGTFSLCDGLITARGKAMRCGSVVSRIDIPASPRVYNDYRAYCLFFSKGKCRRCIKRCPHGAISEDGHDKSRCREFLFEKVAAYAKTAYSIESYGCGLCQTGVPCESGIPSKE
jgi:epoxyqueuosine reductase QueG